MVDSYAEGEKLQKAISLNKVNYAGKKLPYTLSHGHIKRGILEKGIDYDIFKKKKKLIGLKEKNLLVR